jgi:hypothetical protein
MTVTADTDESGNVERISISSQPTTVSDELAKRAGVLFEVHRSDAVIGVECHRTFNLDISLRRSERVTRMDMVLPSGSGGTFHGVHREVSPGATPFVTCRLPRRSWES